jgi:SSS family solute:Na+ symporter
MSIVVGYFLLLLYVVKRWGGLKDQSLSEFAVAGRSFKWYMVLFTVIGSWFVGAMYTGWFGWGTIDGIIAQYVTLYSVGGLVIYY